MKHTGAYITNSSRPGRWQKDSTLYFSPGNVSDNLAGLYNFCKSIKNDAGYFPEQMCPSCPLYRAYCAWCGESRDE